MTLRVELSVSTTPAEAAAEMAQLSARLGGITIAADFNGVDLRVSDGANPDGAQSAIGEAMAKKRTMTVFGERSGWAAF